MGEIPQNRVYVGNCKFRFSDIKGDTPDFSLISRCRNLDNHLFALIIPIRGFKKKYSIADIMVKSRYALRYQGAVALISRISTQLSALLPPRPIFPTKPVLPNSELILHTKGSLYYLPWYLTSWSWYQAYHAWYHSSPFILRSWTLTESYMHILFRGKSPEKPLSTIPGRWKGRDNVFGALTSWKTQERGQ